MSGFLITRLIREEVLNTGAFSFGNFYYRRAKRIFPALFFTLLLEVAILDIKPNQEKKFEDAFCKAQKILSSMEGYISHQLQMPGKNNRYILLVNWQPLDDHKVGFRQS